MINLSLSEYTLSCRLPSSVFISDVSGAVEVQVLIDGVAIYETTLQAIGGSVTLYEFRMLVHDYMFTHHKAIVRLGMSVNRGQYQVQNKYIVYADLNPAEEDEEAFFDSSFLSLQQTVTIPRSMWFSIPYLLKADATFTPRYTCVFRRADGSYATVVYESFATTPSQDPRIYNLSLSASSICSGIREKQGVDYGTLLSATLQVGQRFLNIFFVDETPALVFQFQNVFNCPEYAFFFGTIKQKNTFDFKEAKVGGSLTYYDQTKERVFEVETRALTIAEATHLNQLFSSSSVALDVTNWQDEVILFSDITSEITDAANEQIRLKFSFRIASGTCWQDPETYVPQIFTDHYSHPFT